MYFLQLEAKEVSACTYHTLLQHSGGTKRKKAALHDIFISKHYILPKLGH